MEERGGRRRLTLFYGFPETTRRRDCWTLLRSLASRSTLPWCVLGDINNLLHTSDKGRFPPPSWLLNGFQNAIRDCNLIDMPLEGYPFMWCKSLGTPSAVEERLDCALATSEWFQVHPQARLQNLMAPSSDHSPIMLECDGKVSWRRARRFRFENVWLHEPNIGEVVTSGWTSIQHGHIMNKMQGCTDALMAWSKKLRLRFKADIDGCKRRLLELWDIGTTEAYREMEGLNHKLCKLLI